ncbi:MAG TPA: hypothetical protein VN854_00600 [Mycoplasmatales bacterium]|jgi:hypothetical protein|nr:hypothetical protein [Mycoplasmatales bacterium]
METNYNKEVEKAENLSLFDNRELVGFLVGLVLGDASISSRLEVTMSQSRKHSIYLNQALKILSGFLKVKVGMYHRTFADIRYKGKLYYSSTLRIPIDKELIFLRNIFYDNGKSKRKMIPLNIADYLTPMGLAHWISCDGQACQRGGLFLCTDSFKKEEVEILIEALKTKFNLESKLSKKKSYERVYWRIYISGQAKNWQILKELILPYLDNSMLYKIRVNNVKSGALEK